MENERESKENKNKKTVFQITCAILIGLLLVGIIVQICIIVNLKNKIDKTKHQNDEIPQISEDKMLENWQEKYLLKIQEIVKNK